MVPITNTGFNPEKGLAALMYLVKHSTHEMYTALKMLYVADKRHLAVCGRFIADDDYCAMKEGATPSGVYDIIKDVRDNRSKRFWRHPEADQYICVSTDHKISLVRDVPTEHLSDVAIDCLRQTIRDFKNQPGFNYWRDLAHDAAWTKTSRKASMDVMDIAETLPPSTIVMAAIADPAPGVAE